MRMHKRPKPVFPEPPVQRLPLFSFEILEFTKVQARHDANLRRRLLSILRRLSILRSVERLFNMRRPRFIEQDGQRFDKTWEIEMGPINRATKFMRTAQVTETRSLLFREGASGLLFLFFAVAFDLCFVQPGRSKSGRASHDATAAGYGGDRDSSGCATVPG